MKNFDSVKHIVYAHEHDMGPMKVRQPLPENEVTQVGPFVLLHHAAPRYYEPKSEPPRLGPHPHRGFEPVTFLFDGGLFHRDSLGNEGHLEAGDVQWMTSGSGILHSEGPSPEFLERGGNLELIQLWINLPAKNKMDRPKYQDIKSSDIPSLFKDQSVNLKLVSGEYNGLKGPASTYTEITAIMGDMQKGKEITLEFPVGHESLVYILDGAVDAGDKTDIKKYNMLTFDNVTGKIYIKAIENSRLLILNATPINEPVVAYGPFVMNTMDEIRQAYSDYHAGKFGTLTY